MFGKNPIVKIKTLRPGDKAVVVSTGRTVEVIMKGNGTNIGVRDVDSGDTWNMSGEIAVRKA